MKELDSLLGEGEPERKPTIVSNGLDTLHITEYAFEKAYAYARLAVQKAGRTMECGGYLIAPKDARDRIATDSFLAKNQDVSGGLFTIEAEDVIKAGREINEIGCRVLGWWHSHGNLETFFSAADDNGQRTVLNEISAFNYITQSEEKEIGNLEVRTKNGKIVIFDRRNPERKYEIEVDGNKNKISIAKLRLQQEKRTGFAYGLVVNNRKIKKEPYAEIATRDLCGFCRNSRDKSVPVNITLFDAGKFKIDEDALMAEIEDRVRMPPRFFSFFGRGKYKGRQGQTPLFNQQTVSFGGYDYPTKEEDDFYMVEFGTPAPKYSIGDEVRITRGAYKNETGKIEYAYRNGFLNIIRQDGKVIGTQVYDVELIEKPKPINPAPSNSQPIKENTPSDKKDKQKQRSQKQNGFDTWLSGEEAEGGKNSGGENGSK
ncbi:Mov34/MPN/PAD-1 family protein [Candidatus Pacearchaeota archaeon]|nr:Mov34/MPN/PAD-1 family protein [Candidatus Pacearchaeota archaeon]